MIQNINTEYGGLLYIERNNVEVTLCGLQQMSDITVSLLMMVV